MFEDILGRKVGVGDYIVTNITGRLAVAQITKISEAGNLLCHVEIRNTGEGMRKYKYTAPIRIIHPDSINLVKIEDQSFNDLNNKL